MFITKRENLSKQNMRRKVVPQLWASYDGVAGVAYSFLAFQNFYTCKSPPESLPFEDNFFIVYQFDNTYFAWENSPFVVNILYLKRSWEKCLWKKGGRVDAKLRLSLSQM